MTIWSILQILEIFYGRLVYFVVIWYVSPRFGMLYQEKSGNRASGHGVARCVKVRFSERQNASRSASEDVIGKVQLRDQNRRLHVDGPEN
jgi:hypothetical protein